MQNSKDRKWPGEMDALSAASQYHFLLFKNARVQALDTVVPPGQMVPLHTHRWPGFLHIQSWSDFVRRDGEGKIVMDSRTSGKAPMQGASWPDALPPHTLENVGETEIRAISVGLKNA